MQELKINPEFKNLIPPLAEDEFQELERLCVEHGIRDSIVTWNGFIIDGHNRYEISQRYDLPFSVVEMDFESEEGVKEWMILNQFGRRNLSNYQRSVLALRLEDVFSARAKEKQVEAGKNKVVQISEQAPMERKSISKLAKVANVSHDTIAKVKAIEAKAPEEVKEKLRTGEVSINQAYQEIRKEEKKEEREKYIEKQKAQIKENKLPELLGLYDIISVDPPWNYGREYDPDGSRVANPYPEMSIEEIKAINLPFNENAILFLWTTHKFLPDAFDILKNWGFEYKATLVWNKEKIGMGSWFRMQCEFCLFGIKGKPLFVNTTERDIITEARREHSRKPDSFFDMVDKTCVGRKLEYFSREKREGWEIFGNETNKF
jgi:N6-adenosine-specific RNA methylase IME4